MPDFLAILASLAGAVASILMLVLLLAASPNSSRAQWARLKAWMISILLFGFAALVAAVLALLGQHPWTAAVCGGSPCLFVVLAFVILSRQERRELDRRASQDPWPCPRRDSPRPPAR